MGMRMSEHMAVQSEINLLDDYYVYIMNILKDRTFQMDRDDFISILEEVFGKYLGEIFLKEWEIIQKIEILEKWENEHANSLALLITNENQKINLQELNEKLAKEIAKRKVREIELVESERKLKDQNQRFSEFAYIVSHDLKMPLRAISQISDWLLKDHSTHLNVEGKNLVNLLIQRVKRMNDLIEGVLSYSQVGRKEEKSDQIHLTDVLSEMIESLSAPKRIKIEIQPNFPDIVASKIRIFQLFQNLVGNAIKYMNKPEGRISLGWSNEGSHWKFFVQDNGPGIPKKDHERIFQIFQTVKVEGKDDSTGIGLSISKKIVELYGGRLWLESTPGEGSTFYFTIAKYQRE